MTVQGPRVSITTFQNAEVQDVPRIEGKWLTKYIITNACATLKQRKGSAYCENMDIGPARTQSPRQGSQQSLRGRIYDRLTGHHIGLS